MARGDKRSLEKLADALEKQAENSSIMAKSLQVASISNRALAESYAEMEAERDHYRMAFNLAVGRLAAYTPNIPSQALVEGILGEAFAEITNRRSETVLSSLDDLPDTKLPHARGIPQ